LGFSHEEDARRVKDVLPKRFEKYGLTLHPEKTRRVPFERPRGAPHEASPGTRTPPGTFDLLGFTHFWTRSRKGNWVVRRTTSKNRLSRGLKALAQWLREVRHEPRADQHRTLSQKLRGHFASYGITGNGDALNRFRRGAIELWRKWLRRSRENKTRAENLYNASLPEAEVARWN
jgi:RNA-directed DNA polymerase